MLNVSSLQSYEGIFPRSRNAPFILNKEQLSCVVLYLLFVKLPCLCVLVSRKLLTFPQCLTVPASGA